MTSNNVWRNFMFSGIGTIVFGLFSACGDLDILDEQSLIDSEDKADAAAKKDDPLKIEKAWGYYNHRVSDDELWLDKWPNKNFPNEIKKQVGDVTENLWRGAQPDPTGKKFIDYKMLAEHGIRSIVSFREAGPPLSSKNFNESRFIEEYNNDDEHPRKLIAKQIPVLDGHHPTLENAIDFLNFLVEEKEDGTPNNLPAYVHCHLGQGRAGSFVAMYRMVFNNMANYQGWSEFKNNKSKFSIKAMSSENQYSENKYQVDQAIDEARSHGVTRCGQLQFLIGFGEALNKGEIQYDKITNQWSYTKEAKAIINAKKDVATMYKFSDGENCKEVTSSPKESRDPLL